MKLFKELNMSPVGQHHILPFDILLSGQFMQLVGEEILYTL